MSVRADSVTSSLTERLQVGDWSVAPSLNELTCGGRRVRVEPKVMAVLVHLAERADQVVSRHELLSVHWPGVVVGDDALTQVVLKLRKALANGREQPAYIETIAKRGYRLIAPVVRPGEAAIGDEPAAVGEPAAADDASPAAAVEPTGHAGPVPGNVAALGSSPSSRRLGVGAVLVVTVAAILATMVEHESGSTSPPGGAAIVADADALRHPTVAIRPFDALGDDPKSRLLAQGLAADLMTDLSKVFGLRVIGAASLGGQAGNDVPADAATSRYRVSGSVQRVDDRLRVHVRLTDVRSGVPLWSERFDRAHEDFFALQEELGSRLLQVLPAKVSEAELRRVAQRHTRDLRAYEYFQQGQSALLVRQRAENEDARKLFMQAIDRDAAFARAYAGLALTHAADYRNRWTPDRGASLERAFEMARTAHQIDPDVRETYWVLAFVHLERLQHEQALQYLQAAIRLYPSFADGYALMGGILTYIGRPADTLPLMRTAMRLNPQSGHLYFLILGRAYLFLGDLEQARVNLQHALARNPVNLETHVFLAAVQALAGDGAAASWTAEEIRMLQPEFSSRSWLETYPMTDQVQRDSLARALARAGL